MCQGVRSCRPALPPGLAVPLLPCRPGRQARRPPPRGLSVKPPLGTAPPRQGSQPSRSPIMPCRVLDSPGPPGTPATSRPGRRAGTPSPGRRGTRHSTPCPVHVLAVRGGACDGLASSGTTSNRTSSPYPPVLPCCLCCVAVLALWQLMHSVLRPSRPQPPPPSLTATT